MFNIYDLLSRLNLVSRYASKVYMLVALVVSLPLVIMAIAWRVTPAPHGHAFWLGTAAGATALALVVGVMFVRSMMDLTLRTSVAVHSFVTNGERIRLPRHHTDEVGRLAMELDELLDELKVKRDLAFKEGLSDALTGLPNRRALLERLQLELQNRRPQIKDTVLVYAVMNVDNFRRVSAQFGHDFGDSIIRQYAHRLSNAVRGTDLVVRLEGVEFAVVARCNILHVAKLVTRLAKPQNFEGLDEPLTACAGYAVCDPTDQLDYVMSRAASFLAAAKTKGAGSVDGEALHDDLRFSTSIAQPVESLRAL